MTRSILMLAWEYPPKVIGGLARHAGYLSRALAAQGHRVIVLTQGDGTLPPLEDDHGVRVVRLPVHEPRPRDFTGWVKRLNFEMVERAVSMFTSGQRFDIIHAHDWLAAYAGKTLKHGLAVPLVATVHATEYGRNNGLHNDLQRYISTVEWSLTYEAWRVICCSRFMEQEIHRVFQTPIDKIRIVPNGIHVPDAGGRGVAADEQFRRRFAAPHEQLIFFMGRLVYEKGVHVLLDALPDIVRRRPGTRLVIAGDGPLRDEFERQAGRLGISHLVTFYGFADDIDRDRFLRVSQAAVFPSLYEPFGIVALEAMAAQVPVVVGSVGGFAEIVRHEETGLHAPPGDAPALADAIVTLLSDEALAARVRDAALRDVKENYAWSQIAAVTADIYDEVLHQYERSRWDAAEHRRRSDDLSALHVLQRLLHHIPAGYDDARAARGGHGAQAERGDERDRSVVDEVVSRYTDTRTPGAYSRTMPERQRTAASVAQNRATR